MNLLRTTAVIAILLSPYTADALNEPTQFPSDFNTGNNATIVLPAAAEPRTADSPLRKGDEIGVFARSGLCVGSIVWQGRNQAITIWGDDMATDEIDGLEPGEPFYLRVWRADDDKLFRYVNVVFDNASARYGTDGIYVITEFIAAAQMPPPAVNNAGDDRKATETTVTLEWDSPFLAESYDVELATDERFEGNRRFFGGIEEESLTIEDLDYSTTYFWRVRANDDLGAGEWSPGTSFTTAADVSNEDEFTVPATLHLHQNFPNPFNPSTVVPFDIDQPQHVQIHVYDMTGRHVTTLADGFVKAGSHRVEWNAAGHASGNYLIVLTAENAILSQKTLLLK